MTSSASSGDATAVLREEQVRVFRTPPAILGSLRADFVGHPRAADVVEVFRILQEHHGGRRVFGRPFYAPRRQLAALPKLRLGGGADDDDGAGRRDRCSPEHRVRTALAVLTKLGWLDREAQVGKTHRTGDDGQPWRKPIVYRWGIKALGAFARFSHWMRKKIALMKPTTVDPVKAVLQRCSSQMESRGGSLFYLGGQKGFSDRRAAQMVLDFELSRPRRSLPTLSEAAKALFRRSDSS